MTPERWERVQELYHNARARSERERPGFLTETCAGDEALRHEVQALLDQPISTGGFVDFLGGPAPVRLLGAPLPTCDGQWIGGYGVRTAARQGRHGRGLSRPRHRAWPRRGDQGPAASVRGRPRAAGALRARSADAGLAQSSQHRRHLRRSRRPAACRRSCWSSSRAKRWPIGSQRGPCPSTKRCRSRGRSPTRSRRRTRRASSTAI